MEIGKVGVAFRMDAMTTRQTVLFARRLGDLGYRVLWIPEDSGREPFAHAAHLLAKTDRLVVATGIANVWVRDAITTAAAAATLAELSHGRFILGLGVSHAPMVAQRGHAYQRPFSYMRQYLAMVKAAPYQAPKFPHEVPIVLGALKPKMLQLAASETRGALLAFVPPEFTARARLAIGPQAWLCVDQLVIMESQAEKARNVARALLRPYVPTLSNYTEILRGLGWLETHFADGCSDRLVDAIIAWAPKDESDSASLSTCKRAQPTFASHPSALTVAPSPTSER